MQRNRPEGQLLLLQEVQLKLTYLLDAHQIRRLVEVVGELLNHQNVPTNGVRCNYVVGVPQASVDEMRSQNLL
jgi:hypothetical protein